MSVLSCWMSCSSPCPIWVDCFLDMNVLFPKTVDMFGYFTSIFTFILYQFCKNFVLCVVFSVSPSFLLNLFVNLHYFHLWHVDIWRARLRPFVINLPWSGQKVGGVLYYMWVCRSVGLKVSLLSVRMSINFKDVLVYSVFSLLVYLA